MYEIIVLPDVSYFLLLH